MEHLIVFWAILLFITLCMHQISSKRIPDEQGTFESLVFNEDALGFVEYSLDNGLVVI